MIKLASDENFDGDMVRGLLRLRPGLAIDIRRRSPAENLISRSFLAA